MKANSGSCVCIFFFLFKPKMGGWPNRIDGGCSVLSFLLFSRTPPPDNPPATIFNISSSLGGRFVDFLWLKAGTLKCARLEFSGCRLKPRRPRSQNEPIRGSLPQTQATRKDSEKRE